MYSTCRQSFLQHTLKGFAWFALIWATWWCPVSLLLNHAAYYGFCWEKTLPWIVGSLSSEVESHTGGFLRSSLGKFISEMRTRWIGVTVCYNTTLCIELHGEWGGGGSSAPVFPVCCKKKRNKVLSNPLVATIDRSWSFQGSDEKHRRCPAAFGDAAQPLDRCWLVSFPLEKVRTRMVSPISWRLVWLLAQVSFRHT